MTASWAFCHKISRRTIFMRCGSVAWFMSNSVCIHRCSSWKRNDYCNFMFKFFQNMEAKKKGRRKVRILWEFGGTLSDFENHYFHRFKTTWNIEGSFLWTHMLTSYPYYCSLTLSVHILSLSSTSSSICLLPRMSSMPRLFVLSQGHGQSGARAHAPSSYWPFVPPLSQTSFPWAT